MKQKRFCNICGDKHTALGLCRRHYNRLSIYGTLGKNCKQCGVDISFLRKNNIYCPDCRRQRIRENEIRKSKTSYQKKKKLYGCVPYIAVPTCGVGTYGIHSLFIGKKSKNIKKVIARIKNNVLNDCIKNPRKYLDE